MSRESREQLAEKLGYAIKGLLTRRYENSLKIAIGIITQNLPESSGVEEVSPAPSPGDIALAHSAYIPLDSPEELNRVRNEFAKANERAVKAESEIGELKAALRWTPVEEKMPMVGERVLISIHGIGKGAGHKTRTTGLWTGKEWLRGSLEKAIETETWPIKGTVTHWMSLPKPVLAGVSEGSQSVDSQNA